MLYYVYWPFVYKNILDNLNNTTKIILRSATLISL